MKKLRFRKGQWVTIQNIKKGTEDITRWRKIIGVSCKVKKRTHKGDNFDYVLPVNIEKSSIIFQEKGQSDSGKISLWYDEELRKATKEEIKKFEFRKIAERL